MAYIRTDQRTTMPKLDKLQCMLPSKAREALFNYFLARFEEAPLNFMADPIYYMMDAMAEVQKSQNIDFWDQEFMWIRKEAFTQYDLALKEYNRRHHKCWDNEKQKAYRS